MKGVRKDREYLQWDIDNFQNSSDMADEVQPKEMQSNEDVAQWKKASIWL